MKRVHIYITGWVQGVGFRYYTCQKAMVAKVYGWVKNLPDGRVEIIAEGENENIELFISSLTSGTLSRHIEKLEKKEEPYTGQFDNFYISYNEEDR